MQPTGGRDNETPFYVCQGFHFRSLPFLPTLEKRLRNYTDPPKVNPRPVYFIIICPRFRVKYFFGNYRR